MTRGMHLMVSQVNREGGLLTVAVRYQCIIQILMVLDFSLNFDKIESTASSSQDAIAYPVVGSDPYAS